MTETKTKVMTGFCENGQHEGMRKKSPSGKPLKACTMIHVCSCACHKDMDELFKASGMERVAQDNPEYVPYSPTFWMPSEEDRVAMKAAARAESEVKFDADETPTFNQTPTGQKARGELEWEVKQVTDAWMDEVDPPMLTCKLISQRIQERNPERSTPSAGAIQAVLIRWQKLGYSTVGEKPVRFTGLTAEGMSRGLDYLKNRAKIK